MPKVLTNRRVQVLTGAFLVLALIGVFGSMGFASVVRSTTKEANQFLRSSSSSKMYSSDGRLLANLHGEIDRDPVALEDMPRHLRDAVIAIEDRRFYGHRGIDLRGTLRALISNLRSGSRHGGSTISQQLAKNLYFHGEPRTWSRKATEALMTLGIEGLSNKDAILEAYLNTAYFGRGVYGVQSAAASYFRKKASELTLPESAFLAGLIHMPGRYDYAASDAPAEQRSRKRAAVARRDLVLDAMADVGFISRSAARDAARKKVDLRPPRDPRWRHPYFVDAVLRQLGVLRNRGEDEPDDRFKILGDSHSERAQAVYRNGLRIYTTLDTDVQKNAEAALEQQLPPGLHPKLSSALVTLEPGSGHVRALIGGRDYYPKGCDDADDPAMAPVCRHAKVNLALGSLAGGSGRQPGSAFKTVVLAAALENGLSLKQTVNSSPFKYKEDERSPEWNVQNYEGSGGGQMSVIDATAKSVNAAYARLAILVLGEGKGSTGASKIARMARKLGFDLPTADDLRKRCGDDYLRNGGCTPADMSPATALGAKEVSPLEMAGAYATFANDGVYAKPTFVTKITDASGKVLFRAKPERHRAVSEMTAHGVSHVLQQVIQRGTGRAAALERPAAGKTGTSQAWRDAWFAGYIPQLTTAVWVGNPVPVQQTDGSWTSESMTPSNGYGMRITGGSYPARIWGAHMGPTVSSFDVEGFPAASTELFKPPKQLKDKLGGGEEKVDVSGSWVGAMIGLRRDGFRVVEHTQCPPGGGNGIRIWKTEKRGNTVHVYKSRAVC